ncbi:hypothetical protein QUF76_18285, partial [Desulfobacterales bacterium HSG16]|nr:hypothetical protein [Desulfobacterales bacterium HSG16]
SFLKECRVQTGMQMMVGLPGDDEATVMETALKIVEMSPDFIRIYPVVVLKNTGLANLYRKGKYQPFSLEESVRITAKIYLLFEKHNIPIVRMGLLAHKDLEAGTMILAGPYHPAFGHLVYSKVFLDRANSEIDKMKIKKDRLEIRVHPRNISRVRGHKNKNIEIINGMWNFHAIDVKRKQCRRGCIRKRRCGTGGNPQ